MLTAHQARIEARSIPVTESGCWLWTAQQGWNGYGRDSIGKANYLEAHRSSYAAFRGEIPLGMCVCHKCDTPTCVNPDHLFLGTHADNMRDMLQKGRARLCGERRADSRTCVKGHDLSNGYVWRNRVRCRSCNEVAVAKYRAKRAALAEAR